MTSTLIMNGPRCSGTWYSQGCQKRERVKGRQRNGESLRVQGQKELHNVLFLWPLRSWDTHMQMPKLNKLQAQATTSNILSLAVFNCLLVSCLEQEEG